MTTIDYAAARFLFIGILAASLIFSIGVIALGIWILSDASIMSYWLNQIVVTDYGALTVTLRMTSYLPIGLGLIAIFTFSIGTAHLMRGGKTLLIAFIVSSSLAALLELLLTLVPMSMWSQVATELPLYMQASLQNDYRGLPNGVGYPNSIFWDAMQIELECCGFNGPSDYTKNYKTYANYWHSNFRYYQADKSSYSGMSYMFPVSCCRFNDKGFVATQDFANYENYVTNKRCPVDGEDYYGNNCQQPLKDYVYVYFAVVLAASFVMLVLHIGGIVLSGFLLKRRLVPEAPYETMGSKLSLVGLRRAASSGKISPDFRQRWDRQPAPVRGGRQLRV